MLDGRPQITIRAAEESDVEFAHSLSKKAFSQYGPYEDMLERWFQSGTTETLLALMGKRPVGFAMLGRHQSEWDSRQIAELLAIAVEPAKQKKGIGDSLIREVVRKARELRIETVVLYTALENVASLTLKRTSSPTTGGLPQTTETKVTGPFPLRIKKSG